MLSKILIGICLAYLLLVLAIYLRQDRLLFNAHVAIETTPAEHGLDYEDLRLETSDGLAISAWYLPRPDSPYALLFLHGNSDNLGDIVPTLHLFHRMGFNCLAIDYRGYGSSPGRPSERGTYRDAEAAWDFLLREKGFDANHVVVLGRSLGGAIAAWLASRHRPAAVVLESTFTTLETLAHEQYPYLPVALLLRYHYPTLERMAAITSPVLVVHSREDEVIAYDHGERLFAAASEPKQLLTIHGRHYDGHETSGQLYSEGLLAFFRQHVGPLPERGISDRPSGL